MTAETWPGRAQLDQAPSTRIGSNWAFATRKPYCAVRVPAGPLFGKWTIDGYPDRSSQRKPQLASRHQALTAPWTLPGALAPSYRHRRPGGISPPREQGTAATGPGAPAPPLGSPPARQPWGYCLRSFPEATSGIESTPAVLRAGAAVALAWSPRPGADSASSDRPRRLIQQPSAHVLAERLLLAFPAAPPPSQVLVLLLLAELIALAVDPVARSVSRGQHNRNHWPPGPHQASRRDLLSLESWRQTWRTGRLMVL